MTAKPKRIRRGGFTWERSDHGKEERWEVVLPQGLKLTHFCVKNYGGEPNEQNAFSGWRLVSGGPFTRAGGWMSREEAMIGAAPFIAKYYREDAKQLMARAKKTLRLVERFMKGQK